VDSHLWEHVSTRRGVEKNTDLHQSSQPQRLYRRVDMATDPIDCQLGCASCEKISTVVILKEQKRTTDETWADFLTRSNVLNNKNSPSIDFREDPWANAPLVTPRHGVANDLAKQGDPRQIRDSLMQYLYPAPTVTGTAQW
jgi:hypothetical protein